MPRRLIFVSTLAATLLATTLAAQAQTPSPPSNAATIPAAAADQPAGVDSKDPAKVPVLAPLIADSERLTTANDPNRFTKPRFLTHDAQSGYDVWFTSNKDNEAKIVYTNPAGTVISGGRLFAVNPANPNGELVYLLGQHTLAAMAILASEGKLPPATSNAPNQSATSPTIPPATSSQSVQPQAALPRPQLKGGAILAAFDAATWIESGTNPTAPLVYAVVDPECPYCANFTSAILSDLDAGRVRVRWIVSAPLASGNSGKSLASATDILAAPPTDRASAWIDHTEHRPSKPSNPSARNVARAQVVANDQMRMTILDANGLSGVPFLLYRTKDGQLGYRLGINASEVPTLVTSLGPLHTGN